MPTEQAPFTFADLFAGIGGFHAALASYGGTCEYAVEIDPAAAKVYELNWGLDPLGDVTKDANDERVTVPPVTVLTGGFPCQSFSKSGAQRGMDEARGTLFWNIARIVEATHPPVVILENVRNLVGPRHRHEWETIVRTLRELGYRVSDEPSVMSPNWLPLEQGGRPQVRERVFITATWDPDDVTQGLPVLPAITDRDLRGGEEWDLAADLPLDEDHHVEGCDLTDDEVRWIDAWDAWVKLMWALLGKSEHARLPGHPIWADAWPTTKANAKRLDQAIESPATPGWKRNFLIKNRDLYLRYQEPFDAWLREYRVLTSAFPPSRRKFEWQAQHTASLWDCVMHLRPSGIRAKRPTYLPALVAITQTSIIGPRGRRISPTEAARLQGLPDGFRFGDQSDAATYRQLGNGVNVGVVAHVLRKHVERDRDILKVTAPDLVHAVLDSNYTSPDDVLPGLLANRGE